ncbi:putative pseudouridine synthase I, TruA [Rosa chinensis]|uniref:Putative pseudouridine synthase I, TruA n=1 Tax=Rosa chinensis TaxID=74649 RepID=A0A2P6RZ71_ROSCH|nr:putative pseudouridine synthase I, TruA [Rosa chinensis]
MGWRWTRLTFEIVVSYRGGSFDGWQNQLDLYTIQRIMCLHCLTTSVLIWWRMHS